MKKTFPIILSALIYLPACLLFSLCIEHLWQPTAYMVSFPRLFALLITSFLATYFFHRLLLKKKDYSPWRRSLIWIWTGPAFLIFLATSYWRQKTCFKDNKSYWSYFFSDSLIFLIYIASTISLTLLNYKPVTHEMLFQYKKKHISKGLMYYKKDWGWVDKIHYRPDHFNEILKALEDYKTEITLHDGWTTPLRFPVHYSCTYEFVASTTPMERWAQATAMSTHFMALNERVQEESPWYHGNQLSAWQFDDLSSGLLACLQQCPDESLRPSGLEIFNTQEVLAIWSQEGKQQVPIKMDLDQSWALVHNKQIRPLIENAQWKIKELVIKH
ncbi:hypothetical protein PQO01_06425 [Lentisphaera marina]|uniref:hypothetical protein n=1 Tax=Lentisphaera marina TaxID=1111041 RepID=UPI002366AFBB|nr:hypothetical protein [Lentisphaera marina]MDD7984582.1 hypothetical protein [Lentisphaera marina]